LFDATRKTLCEKEKEKRWQQKEFMRDYDDIRAEIDEIGIEMD